MGLTGPNARASGVDWDLRAHAPYGAYREIQVQPILLHNGDVYDRYLIRLFEMRQSLDIIEQLLDGLPERPLDRRRPQGRAAAAPRAAHLDGVADPPLQARHRGLPRAGRRGLRATSRARAASSAATSSRTARAKPWRVHFRSASLVMLQSRRRALRRRADRRPDRDPRLARPEHGGLRPVSATPETLYDAIQAQLANYPTRRGAMLPALHLTQEAYGWLSPEALIACSDAIGFSPGLLPVGRVVLRHVLPRAGRHARDRRVHEPGVRAVRRGRGRRGVRAGARRARRRDDRATARSRCARPSASAAAAGRPSSPSTSATASA